MSKATAWTWDDRIDATAAVHEAASILAMTKHLQAEQDLNDACGDVQEGAPASILEAPMARLNTLPNPRFCPTICPLCQLGNIYGQMTCLDENCPGRRQP